ncbi:hypothetical protein AAY473_034363 [Plecturocebus cupreus]
MSKVKAPADTIDNAFYVFSCGRKFHSVTRLECSSTIPLSAISVSRVQAILLPQPPKLYHFTKSFRKSKQLQITSRWEKCLRKQARIR